MVDLKDPKLLAIGAVVIVGGIVLLKSGGGASSAQMAQSNMAANTGNNAIGGTYSYLDGSGVQHLIATDPNGDLTSYSADQPPFSSPSSGALSTYTGYMGSLNNGTPWLYGGSPGYATGIDPAQPGQGLSSTSSGGPYLIPTGQIGQPYPGAIPWWNGQNLPSVRSAGLAGGDQLPPYSLQEQ